MPFLTRQVTTENDALAAYASQQIRQLATALDGLDDEQLRATPTASEMSLGGIARHCLFVGQEGILMSFDPARAETHGLHNYEAGTPGAEVVRPEDTSASLAAALRDMADWVERVVQGLDLDSRVPVPGQPWFPQDIDTWPARWVALHLVEEYARHSGHADILREQIDGKGTYELNALADGEPWPPVGWEDYTWEAGEQSQG